jgi:hypothetical protein
MAKFVSVGFCWVTRTDAGVIHFFISLYSHSNGWIQIYRASIPLKFPPWFPRKSTLDRWLRLLLAKKI